MDPALPPDSAPVILWFRRDLRLADQPALNAALATGRRVLPLFVLDDETPGPWAAGGASRWWLHHSLTRLSESLAVHGAALILRRGRYEDVIPAFAAETGAAEIHTGVPTEPWSRGALRRLKATLRIPLKTHLTTLLHRPDAIRTRTGTPFSVFTPFANACLAVGELPAPEPAPQRIPSLTAPSDMLETWRLLPSAPDWASGLRGAWMPGESAAHIRLARFRAENLSRYAARRDLPGVDGTSMLSPYLAFGELSARHAWQAADPKFRAELLWREFSAHLLWHHETLAEAPLRPAFAAMPWRSDPAALSAWQQGRTGIPIVDAGMRQLWQTGWMHNRVRMVVASFLDKHLMLPWQRGQAWFHDTLVDADLASNAASWQWVAGSGADAAPYFRVFNPVLQGRKFDPEGAYVRRYVPELAALPDSLIHAPWEAPPILRPRTYPSPVIDLAAGRARALEAYAALPKTGAETRSSAS